VNLTPALRQTLRQHLEEPAIIPRRDRPAKRAVPGFTDRQLEGALKHLRGVLEKGG
jgi:hypothetical protein